MLTIGSTYHRPRARPPIAGTLPALATLALCACFVLGIFVLCAGYASAARASSTLVVTGAGDGHGVGMSQDGALGYAQHGWSDQAILAHYYTGTTIGQAPPGAVVRVLVGAHVKQVPLERYVRGVVSAEMPAGWPLAALEAQAIASRTYALTAHAGGTRFDVYSDTRSQVYRGPAAETAQTNAAVTATAGQIVTYAGSPAITYFFASSGGMTENVANAWPGAEQQPWLRGVADPYDIGPQFDWSLSLSFAAAGARLHGLVPGSFRGIEVLRRGVSPRILTAAVLGSAGATQISGAELAARLGLQDTWAYFSVRRGSTLTPEPDASGQPPPSPAGAQGGAQAPGAGAAPVAAESAPAGGVTAK
jgi:SpoIID/LytB domain protein